MTCINHARIRDIFCDKRYTNVVNYYYYYMTSSSLAFLEQSMRANPHPPPPPPYINEAHAENECKKPKLLPNPAKPHPLLSAIYFLENIA